MSSGVGIGAVARHHRRRRFADQEPACDRLLDQSGAALHPTLGGKIPRLDVGYEVRWKVSGMLLKRSPRSVAR